MLAHRSAQEVKKKPPQPKSNTQKPPTNKKKNPKPNLTHPNDPYPKKKTHKPTHKNTIPDTSFKKHHTKQVSPHSSL